MAVISKFISCIIVIFVLTATQFLQADALSMSLVNIQGDEEPLANHIGQGKWVVVNVWSPSCSACLTEMPRIKEFRKRNPEIPVLGITLDFPSFGYGKMDILRSYVASNPLGYPLFLADHAQASEAIGRHLVGIPLIAVYRPDGKPVARWPGVVEISKIEQLINDYQEDTDPLSVDFD
ncbi:MAG: TlpA disulfide reductase family protein [Pseudomonadota bacterium]